MVVASRDQVFLDRPLTRRHFIEVAWPVRRFTIEEYERMGEIGMFQSEGHFELLDGLVIWNTDRTDMDRVQKATLLKTKLPLRRFSNAEYHCLIREGLFPEDEQLELIDGLILEMSPINPRHAECVDRTTEQLLHALYRRARVRVQSPITLEVIASEPQPDITVAAFYPEGYRDHHPQANDVLLLIEVADSSLEDDRERKLEVYAGAGIPEYWIMNLIDIQLEVYREPYLSAVGKAEYRTKLTFAPSEIVSPLAFPDCQIDLSQILPE